MVDEKKQSILRPLLILLAAGDLALLGLLLGPWEQIQKLPGGGTTAFDPAITLLAYVGISYWIGSARTAESRKCLFSAALMGILAGLVLAGGVFIANRMGTGGGAQAGYAQYGSMAVAVLLWGVAGRRTIRAGYQAGFAALCAVWSAFFSCTIACGAMLGGSFYSMGPGQSADPWAQYQGLAIGSEAMQALVQSLLTATGYLLLGPLVAVIAGTIFASFTSSANAKK